MGGGHRRRTAALEPRSALEQVVSQFGRRIDTLVREVIDLHEEEIRPRIPNVTPPQLALFDMPHKASHTTMGDFYEMVRQGWYGTERGEYLQVEGNGGDRLLKPDNVSGKRIGEEKAVCAGSTCNLIDAQIMRYHMLQLQNHKKTTSFGFFRHRFEKIKSYRGTREGLFAQLGEKTAFGIELPVSLVSRMWAAGISNEFPQLVYRYPGVDPAPFDENGYFECSEIPLHPTHEVKQYPACTCLRSPTINGFFHHPETMIEALDIDPGLYQIRRLLSPKEMTVEGQSVQQFPVVRITDAEHVLWMRHFLEEYRPQNLFPDTDETIEKSMNAVASNYENFVAKYHRNGDGYHLSRIAPGTVPRAFGVATNNDSDVPY